MYSIAESTAHGYFPMRKTAVVSAVFSFRTNAVETLDTRTLSAYIGRVCALYSRYWYKQKGGGNGTIWEGRLKSIIVQKKLYLNRLGRYIERNPIVADIEGIATPADYQWSSVVAYVLGRADSLVSPARHPYRRSWGETEKQCRRNYLAYINSSENDGEKDIFTPSGAWLGDEKFRQSLQLVSGRLTARKKRTSQKQ